MTINRSDRREVRNPVLALPSAKALLALPPETLEVLAELFGDLALDARARAQASWLKNKGPMAAYWKATGAYARHLRHVARQGLRK